MVKPVEIPMTEASNTPLPENYDREFKETSFSNLGFEDDGTRRLTDETSTLGDAGFTPTVSFPGEGIPLDGATAGGATRNQMIYVANLDGFEDLTYEEINNALISSRKIKDKEGNYKDGWITKPEATENMLNNLFKTDGDIYLMFKLFGDVQWSGCKLTYKEQGNNIVKFYAYSRIEGDYGSNIAELVELVFKDTDGFSEKLRDMHLERNYQISQKDEADRRRHEEWEEMEPGSQNEHQVFNHPTPPKINTL